MLSEFAVGQRWISNAESGLGLGVVIGVESRRVALSFPAADEDRVYSIDAAPLTRIIYKVGDAVKDKYQHPLTILDTLDNNGVTFYKVANAEGEEGILPEIDLDAFVHFSTPLDRLLSGQIDPLKFFFCRKETRAHQSELAQSGAVGLLGPRVQLLPHQLYIADQVARRKHPRVLLADEVGLGKTIEAGLIIHHQLQTHQAQRVCVIVPDSLVHQWLVEMLRRFNLAFSVLDEAMCLALASEAVNPFETKQWVICGASFFTDNPLRVEQMLACDWDLLVVDEAHHLTWSPGSVSEDYKIVERMAQVAKGLLLLTATPEQLGVESHFARLRLLDPDRYYDLDAFLKEESSYQAVNALVDELFALAETKALPERLSEYLSACELTNLQSLLDAEDIEQAQNQAINALLDRHGTGRVLFRNTRLAVQGFPERKLSIYSLPAFEAKHSAESLDELLRPETQLGDDWLLEDARVSWLADQLKGELAYQKVLLICQKATTAIALEEYLRTRQGIKSAVFHEDLSLVARDRAAAYFADPEESAQILICSEIGSEGRNFQFASHLVMFDLPLNPDLLEQRIGRLDRIGQQKDIQIYVPVYEGSHTERLLTWLHEGLNAFEQTCAIGRAVFDQFEEALITQLMDPDEIAFGQLVIETQEKAQSLRALMQQGRDKLMELNSCRHDEAEAVIDNLVKAERRKELEEYVETLGDQLGIDIETHDVNSIIMRPSENMRCGLLPGMRDEGATYTFSRDNALSREDMGFLTWEHPTIQAAMDHILSSEHGNTAIGTIKVKPLPPGTLMLETLYTVEGIAQKRLNIQRYLETSTVRLLVNDAGKDLGHILTEDKLQELIKKVPMVQAQAIAKQAGEIIEAMAEKSKTQAEEQLATIKAAALEKLEEEQAIELKRLQALKAVNPNIRQEEIDLLVAEGQAIKDALMKAGVSLDALRVVMAV